MVISWLGFVGNRLTQAHTVVSHCALFSSFSSSSWIVGGGLIVAYLP